MKTCLLLLCCCAQLCAQTNSSFMHNGVERTFVYYTPSNWNDSSELPLVILMHGLTQTGAGVMDITQFNQLAEQHNFIVVYPDGLNYAWNANMNVTVSTADDLGFIESLATYFQNNLNTNPLKQYLVGFSNGGFMSHKLACESSMCFAAIATVSGNMSDTTYANCSPQFAPAVLHIHGTADAIVPYDGGAATGVSVTQTMEKWRNHLSCSLTPVTTPMPNTSLIDLSSPELITYQNCQNELKHIKITGGGHQWPGIQTLVGGAGTINFDFYSPQVIWDFLNGKSCPSSALDENTLNQIKPWPNPTSDELHIDVAHPVFYKISDLQGNTIKSGSTSGIITMNELAVGMYLLMLDNRMVNMIIKE